VEFLIWRGESGNWEEKVDKRFWGDEFYWGDYFGEKGQEGETKIRGSKKRGEGRFPNEQFTRVSTW